MKTNKILRLTILVASFSAVLFGCKKENSTPITDSSSVAANMQIASDDQTMVSNESDAVSNDAISALNGNATVTGTPVSVNGIVGISICDATVTYDTTSTTKTITIVYNGSNCHGNRTRTGTVIISVPRGQHWKDAGAAVNIQINSLAITRVRDGKTIVINGTKTITNTSGGLLKNLATTDSIVNDITGALSITFSNGSTRSWQVSRHKVFTYNDGIVETITGSHSDGTDNNIATWGTNRFGVSFTNRITSPKVFAQSCDFRLVSGQDSVTRSDNITSVITYGLDANGNPVTACPTGYYYAKLVWTNGNNGKVYTYIYPY
ncbi:MAG: hypothetical protein ACRDE5_04265 [Ginsengibacter sp.]